MSTAQVPKSKTRPIYVHAKSPDDYFATYKFGLYRDSSNTKARSDLTRVVDRRTGGYLQGVQQVWKSHPGVFQGISMFGVATLSDRSTDLFRATYEAGARRHEPRRRHPEPGLGAPERPGWASERLP